MAGSRKDLRYLSPYADDKIPNTMPIGRLELRDFLPQNQKEKGEEIPYPKNWEGRMEKEQ